MEFKTIVADPPWLPTLGATWKSSLKDKARPQKYYPTMTLAEIKALKIPSAPKSHLYLWCLNQHIDWGYDVARAWGFEPVQLLTWCKPGRGTGRFQANSEQIIVGRRGARHGNPFGKTGGTYFNWPRGKHSQKPADFYELVQKTSPGPYLELFARRKYSANWSVWGNEVQSDITISSQAAP